jgi:hypothetical protein
MDTDDNFMRKYEKHLHDRRLRRHLKLARQLQLDPRDLIHSDPELNAAVAYFMHMVSPLPRGRA